MPLVRLGLTLSMLLISSEQASVDIWIGAIYLIVSSSSLCLIIQTADSFGDPTMGEPCQGS